MPEEERDAEFIAYLGEVADPSHAFQIADCEIMATSLSPAAAIENTFLHR
jgi:hypothetical protein